MREMILWDIAAYWGECSLLREQLRHFQINFLALNHRGHFSWTFA